MAKSRLSPIKELTVPRLELMAAVLGSRLTIYVHNEISGNIQIGKKILWSDSSEQVEFGSVVTELQRRHDFGPTEVNGPL